MSARERALLSIIGALPPTALTMSPTTRARLRWRNLSPATRLALGLTCGLGAGAVLAIAVAVQLVRAELPRLDALTNYQPLQPLRIETADGVEIAQFGPERRHFTPIGQIPRLLQDAVLAVEDSRFRSHRGIDWKGVARALFKAATGGRLEGASTITQQVARNFYLSNRRTPERKFKEVLLSVEIERTLSKDQILELYLNQIYLGQRAYGFAAASEIYFGKPMSALSVAETAMLAGLPQNPAWANPVTHAERARQRQLIVLRRMLDTGVITDSQWQAARGEKLALRSPLRAGLHAEHVAELVRRWMVERYGTEVYGRGLRVTTTLRAADQAAAWEALRRGVLAHDRRQPFGGPEDTEDLPPPSAPAAEIDRAIALALREHRDDEMLRLAIIVSASPSEVVAQLASGEQVRLTAGALHRVRAALQPRARRQLALQRGSVIRLVQAPAAEADDRRDDARRGQPDWVIAQWPDVQAALVALDPTSGRLRAWVGGFDFATSHFDHVLRAQRQSGSAIKPLLYSAALEHGVMPDTVINDAELTLAGASGEGAWQPRNHDDRYDGPLTLREALARSKNTVSVRLIQLIGIQPTRAWLQRLGLDLQQQPDNLTLALGSGSVTPLRLAQAYAVYANGGWRVDPVLIDRITDARGQVVYQAGPAPAMTDDTRAIPARNAFVTGSLLAEVTRTGTAARARRELDRDDLYGKTGTTNDAVDAWFAGYHPTVTTVVWMGHDTPTSLGERESGGGLALPIWIEYMRQALAGVPPSPSPLAPDGVQRAGGDWVYEEYADGSYVRQIGMHAAMPTPGALASTSVGHAPPPAPGGSAPAPSSP